MASSELLSELLSIPLAEAAPAASPAQRKAATQALIVEIMTRTSNSDPVLTVLEDAHWIDPTTQELMALTVDRVQELGGAVAAVESGYMKGQLVRSLAARRKRVESGEDVVVGVNRFETTEPSPLQADEGQNIETVDPAVEVAAVGAVRAWRAGRDAAAVEAALDELRDAALKDSAGTDTNLMVASIACAKAGVTTGEWTGALRAVFGEFRAPTALHVRWD